MTAIGCGRSDWLACKSWLNRCRAPQASSCSDWWLCRFRGLRCRCDSASCEQEKCNTLWWRSKRFLPTHPRGDTVTAKHDRKDSSSPISPPPPLPSGSATKCCYPVLVTPSRSATKIILLCNGGSGSRLFCKSGGSVTNPFSHNLLGSLQNVTKLVLGGWGWGGT